MKKPGREKGEEGPLIGRRSLLKAGAFGCVVLAVPLAASWRFQDIILAKQPGAIADFIESTFDYLKLEVSAGEYEQFLNDYEVYYDRVIRQVWRDLRGDAPEVHEERMEHLANTFLLSTDFFQNGMDRSRSIKYVTLFHPHASPCWNPLYASA